MHRWNSDQTSEQNLQICTVSIVNLEKSDLNQFLFINTKGGIRRLLHPVPHGGSGMNTGGAHKLKCQLPLSSWNEQPHRTGRPVLHAHSSRYSEWKFDIFELVVVRSFTTDSNLLQPTVCVNTTPSHVSFSRVSLHTFQWRTWHWLKCLAGTSSMYHPHGVVVYSSTLHTAFFTVSLIFLLILLIFIFIFHVGWFDEKYPISNVRENPRRDSENEQIKILLERLSDACRRRADHSEEESLSSSLSSSVSHDRTGRPVVCRLVSSARQTQRHNSENEQIRTLLERRKEQILADCQAAIRKQEFQADHNRSIQKLNGVIESRRGEIYRALQRDEQHQRVQQLLHEQSLEQNLDLRESHEKSQNEMEELKRFQGSTSETITKRKLIEDRDTILELTSKIQGLQNEINCMNDSRDFQDAEAVCSGQSHVTTSQRVFFPPHSDPDGMLCRSLGMAQQWAAKYLGHAW